MGQKLSFERALQLITSSAIDEAGALVVTDDNLKMLGIITERDIARGLKSHGRHVLDRPLTELWRNLPNHAGNMLCRVAAFKARGCPRDPKHAQIGKLLPDVHSSQRRRHGPLMASTR